MVGWQYGPRPLGPKEIDGLLVPPSKAFSLLTDHLITSKPIWSEPDQEKCFKSNHKDKPLWLIVGCGLYLKRLLDAMASSFWVKVP